MNYLNKRAQKEIMSIISNNQILQVNPGTCRYNYCCHMNAVHDAIIGRDDKIALCIAVKNSMPMIHFVNVKDDFYIDNTLGIWSKDYTFYLIEFIEKERFFEVDDIFCNYRKELNSKLHWFTRMFSNFIC